MNNQLLNNKEKYLLKKQQRQEAQFRKLRQKKLKKILSVLLPITLIGLVATFALVAFLSKDNQSKNLGTGRIETNQTEYNAGDVVISDGLVRAIYQIKNVGDGDLRINSIWTSCMCTTARLKVGDKISPEFGMHTSSMFWSEKIPPGQIGELEVLFDPAFHGLESTGPVVREIYLVTSDPGHEQIKLKLFANVVK